MNDPIEAEVVQPSQAVALRNNNQAVDAPRSVKEIVAQVRLIQEVMREVMHEGEHFGTIPGCGDKKSLLQPGAQKLCMTFRLTPEYTIQEVDLPKGHKEYRIICTLKSIGSQVPVGQGVGACSSMESKYRYRGGARKCPECGKETIIMGKKFKPSDPEPGWLCWMKKGGCGKTWPKGAEAIESQSMEKIENENPADTFNTVLKMAKKRAFVDATITATAASDIFTQDVGDPESDEGNGGVGHPQSNAPKTAQEQPKAAASSKPAQTQKAPPAQGQTAKPPQALAAEVMEKWKQYALGQIKKFHMEQFAYALAMEANWLIPGVDKLEDISAQKFPQTQQAFADYWSTVKGRKQKAIDEGGMPQNIMEAFDKAYLALPLEEPPQKEPAAPPEQARSVPPPITVPRDKNDPDSPDAPWRSFPMPYGQKAGTALAALPKNYLFGLWANVEVTTEYNGRPKTAANIAKDKQFRTMLDEAGKHYNFRKDGEGERPKQGEPHDDMPPDDDDVPF